MNDDQLIDAIAEIWVSNGGDADGLVWCYHKLHDAIKEKWDEKHGTVESEE